MAASHPLAPESPVGLLVDGRRLATLMCTPLDLDELAAGHLLGRGIVGRREDLRILAVCPDQRSVRAETVSGRGALLEAEGLVYSACGAASLPPAAARPGGPAAALPPGAVDFRVSLDELKAWSLAMFAAAELYRATGGLHVAALVYLAGPALAGSPEAGRAPYFVVREDVGRHNAVDKVLGRGLLDGVDFSRSLLLTSGRIAADMAQKAARAGLPLLASRSIPTTEAYALAREAGIALIGRIGTLSPIVYTRPELVRPEAKE
jgi:FdhD protein